MTVCSLDVVKKVCNYLNVSTGSLSYNSDKVITRVTNKNSLEGFATVLRQIVNEARISESGYQSFEEELAMYQWLEFAAMYANQAASNPAFAKTFLQEVNRNLECNSFITGHRFNVADVVWYHILYSILKNLTPAEKEQVLHLCRWYDHLQGDDRLRQGSQLLNFATVHISHRLTASH